MEAAAASAGDVGDVGESERLAGEMGGVLLLLVGETSSVWRSASCPWSSDVA